MRVLVCGSRSWDDYDIIHYVLSGIDDYERSPESPTVVIHGGARGADAMAQRWVDGFGQEYPQPCERYDAEWRKHGRAAGPIRNQRMLDEGKPDVVLAFRSPGESPGTDDMVERSAAAGVTTYVITRAAARAGETTP